jgi:hypothetical protein
MLLPAYSPYGLFTGSLISDNVRVREARCGPAKFSDGQPGRLATVGRAVLDGKEDDDLHGVLGGLVLLFSGA